MLNIRQNHEIKSVSEQVSTKGFEPENRNAKIRAMVAMASTVRDDAFGSGMKFEAYLLDMAVIALSEQLEGSA